jgi:SAM-dependent methyltransferase
VVQVQTTLDPKKIVAEGYDRIFRRHCQWVSHARADERARYTSVLMRQLAPGARVLELGCGVGLPTTRELAEQFSVTGLDISPKQIAQARQNVPGAEFVNADMARLEYPAASFDGIAAFYSIFHVPRQEQAGLLCRLATWLRPGGIFVGTMGFASVETGYEEDWLGAPMYWSSFDAETNKRLVKDAGLRILSARQETADEFGEQVTFLWIVACKPAVPESFKGQVVTNTPPEEVLNFQAVSDTLGTAGQPTADQFASIRIAGYEVVVNLAMPDSTNALQNEAELVAEQGMDYVHIPVIFESPQISDLERFFEAMAGHRCRRVFVHCALNWRVSVFVLLYRVVCLGVTYTKAEELLERIWSPDKVWTAFIDESLAHFGRRR